MLSMVVSIFLSSSGNESKEISMPKNITELYHKATASMLDVFDAPMGDGAAMDSEAVGRMRSMVEATFYQAHAAGARIITEGHFFRAALNLAGCMKMDKDWQNAERVLAAEDTVQLLKLLPEAGGWRKAISSVLDRVQQGRLPLLDTQVVSPLKAQSSHLSFQEYFSARTICKFASESAHVWHDATGDLVPWQFSEWWVNALSLGDEMGAEFASGLLKTAGKSGQSHLDLRAQLGDGLQRYGSETVKRSAALMAISLLMKTVSSFDLRDNHLTPLEVSALVKGVIAACAADKPLEAIRLAGNSIGSDAVRELGEVLATNTTSSLTGLDLERTRMCDTDEFGRGPWTNAGLTPIVELLRHCTKLTELNLANNGLTDDGSLMILKALSEFRHGGIPLGSFDLSKNRLSETACGALLKTLSACKKLTRLLMRDCGLNASCAKLIARAISISHVKHVELSGNFLCRGEKKLVDASQPISPDEPVTSSRMVQGGYSHYAWTSEGVAAIAKELVGLPWMDYVGLDDNCLCGMTQMYSDRELVPCGAYKTEAFEVLTELLRDSKHTFHLEVRYKKPRASASYLHTLAHVHDACTCCPANVLLRYGAHLSCRSVNNNMARQQELDALQASLDYIPLGVSEAVRQIEDADDFDEELAQMEAEKSAQAADEVLRAASAVAANADGVDASIDKDGSLANAVSPESETGELSAADEPSGIAEASAPSTETFSSNAPAAAADADVKAADPAVAISERKGKESKGKVTGRDGKPGQKDNKKQQGGKGKSASKAEELAPAPEPAPPPAVEAPPPEPFETTSVLKVRSDSDPQSDLVVNGLPKGTVVMVLQRKEQADKSVRGQIQMIDLSEPLGWITVVKADGSSPLKQVKVKMPSDAKSESTSQAQQDVPRPMETASTLKVRKTVDPESDLVQSNLPKGSILYILQREKMGDKSERGLIQLAEKSEALGWITVIKADGKHNVLVPTGALPATLKPPAFSPPASKRPEAKSPDSKSADKSKDKKGSKDAAPAVVPVKVEPKMAAAPKLATPGAGMGQQMFETASALKIRDGSDPKSDLVADPKGGNLPKGSKVIVLKRETLQDKSERGKIQLVNGKGPLGWIVTAKADGSQNLIELKSSELSLSAAMKAKEVPEKPKVDLKEALVPPDKVKELNRLLKHTIDKNGLIAHPSATKRRADQKDGSRHDEAPPLEVDNGVKLMFNPYQALFEVAIGEGETVPESDTYMVTARNGKVVGKVKIPPTKGMELEARVVFDNAWLDGEQYGLVHHSAQGTASIELYIKFDETTITLIVSPWLTFSCAIGARFLIRRFGQTEGRMGTVKRVMNDDRTVIHIDGTDQNDVSKLVTINPRPDAVVVSSIIRYPVGTILFYLHAISSTSYSCVDAVVAEMPERMWQRGSQQTDENGFRIPDMQYGSHHWLQLKSTPTLVEADLNEYNHAIQRFATKDDYEMSRVDHCQIIVERHAKVEDAITGNSLWIKDQLVKVDVKASTQGATNTLLGRGVDDVSTLTDILCTPSPRRISGEHPAQALLMRAGPGTGKTWMCKQAVWMLAEVLQHTNDWKGVRLVPFIMYVQQIIYILRDVSKEDVDAISGAQLFTKYVDEIHTQHAEMIKQAWEIRALIVILDGVDEAAGMREMIEDFVLNSLVASGNRVMITSRIEGIADLGPYQARNFSVLDLKELTNEQQRIVIRTQMDGNEFFDHLLALGELRRGMENAYASLKESSRAQLESMYMRPPTEEDLKVVASTPPPSGPELEADLHYPVLEELIRLAMMESFEWADRGEADAEDAEEDEGQSKDYDSMLEQFAIEEMEVPAAKDGKEPAPLHSRISARSGKMIYNFVIRLLGEPLIALEDDADGIMPVQIEFDDGTSASITMVSLLNRYIDLDAVHFRYAICMMKLVSGSTVRDVKIEVHLTDVLKANLDMSAESESGETGEDHYNFFKEQLVGKVPKGRTTAMTSEEVDNMLEPALVFLVDASGVPVLLSLLVLIFSSGGNDLSDLPTNQYKLYTMGIHHAINKRLLSIYQPYVLKPEDGSKIEYNDKQATATVVAIWQQLFALNAANSERVIQEVASAYENGNDPDKGKSKGDKRGGEASDIGSKKATSDVIKASASLGTEDALYDLLKHGAHYLNVATRGGSRTVLNKIELTIAKNIRTVVMTLVEANLKLIRDAGSINNTGLIMLRHVAVTNQLAGRRHFGAKDVARCLLKEMPSAEALTLWLHLDADDDGPPLIKTLESQTEDAEGQYQFKHLSFQEGLFAQYLFMEAEHGKWDGWTTDEIAATFLNDPFMNNTCRIASTRFGMLLGKQRPTWNFSSSKCRLMAQGKRALWLLANPEVIHLDLTENNVGENHDESGEGLGRLVTIDTKLATLKLANNALGKLDWRKQQFTKALASSESLTELNIKNNNLEERGVKMVCNALQTCKLLKVLDISHNRPFREPALPNLLKMHPSLTDVGIIETGKGKLDSRAKTLIGQALLNRDEPKMFALQNDIFQLRRNTHTIEWPAEAEHGDVLQIAGVLKTNTTLTAFHFQQEFLNDDDQEIIGRALLSHREGRVGYCNNWQLYEHSGGPSAGTVNKKGKKGKEKDAKSTAAMTRGEPATVVSFDVKDREVVRSTRSFVLLAAVLKANQILQELTLKSLETVHVSALGSSLRCNDTLQKLRIVCDGDHVISLDVQRLTGRVPKERINLCPSLDSSGGPADIIGGPPDDNPGAAAFAKEDRELLNRTACSLIGELMAENQIVKSLRLNPGKGTEGGMVVQFLDRAKSSSMETLDLNGVKLGDRGAPELFARLETGLCSMLHRLSLRANALNDLNLEAMVVALSKDHCAITSLDLSENPNVSGDLLLKALMSSSTLTSLDMTGCPKITTDLDRVGKFLVHDSCTCPLGFIKVDLPVDATTVARRLAAAEALATEGSAGVDQHTTKKASNKGRMFKISDEDVQLDLDDPSALDLLIGVVRWNTIIKKVDLSKVNIENAKAVEEMLKTNQVLEDLDISQNTFHLENEVNAVINGVANCGSLKSIALDGRALPLHQLRGEQMQPVVDFSEYSLHVLSARVIGELLSDNVILTQLILHTNSLSTAGTQAIVRSLARSAKGTLKLLDLSRNSIGVLAEASENAEAAQEAHEQSLASIFLALGELEKLEQLMLDENALEWINSLHTLRNLRNMTLKGNKLRALPNEMGVLKTLQTLSLQDNLLTRLPRHIEGLSSIQRLDLKNNDLAYLPDAIGRLTSLKVLDISENKRLLELPRTMEALQKDIKLLISNSMRSLASPPYQVVKNGIPDMKRWWAENAVEQVRPTAEAQSIDDSLEGMNTTVLPPRIKNRRPLRNMGEPSRHVWAEGKPMPVLIFNFYNGEKSEVYGNISNFDVDQPADIFMHNDEVGKLINQKPEEARLVVDKRVKLNNSWQRAEIAAEVTSGWLSASPQMKLSLDWGGGRLGYVKMMPHLGFACKAGMRLEFRQPAFQFDVQKTTYTIARFSGCVCVVKVLDSDGVRVRFDNTEKTMDVDPCPAVFRPCEPLKAHDLKQIRPILLLHKDACVDAQLILDEEETGAKNRRFQSTIEITSTQERVHMDLNRFNHSVLSHFNAVAEYETARTRYCDLLMAGYQSGQEMYSSNSLPLKYQTIYIEMKGTPLFAELQMQLAGVNDAVAETDDTGGGRGKKSKKDPGAEDTTAVHEAAARLKHFTNVKQVVDLLAEPSPERNSGVHWSLPIQLLSHGRMPVDRDWLLNYTVTMLARRLGARPETPIHGTKRDCSEPGIRLVPYVVSTMQLEELMGKTDEALTQSFETVHNGQMLYDLIASSKELAEDQRQMLLQALEMSALIVVVNCDGRHPSGKPKEFVEAFLQHEIALSGCRAVIIASAEGEVPYPLSQELIPTFHTRSIGLSFIDVNLSERSASDMLKEVIKDLTVVGEQRRGHLIETLSFAGNGLSKKGSEKPSVQLVGMVAHPSCNLTSLDLSYNQFDEEEWARLAEVLGTSTCLTHLDIRQEVSVDASVHDRIGADLLEPSSGSRLCEMRCNAFDLITGVDTLELTEQPLDRGTVRLLAGVLRHNRILKRLHLTANDMDDDSVDVLTLALQWNLTLEWIGIDCTPLATATKTRVQQLAAQRPSGSLMVQFD